MKKRILSLILALAMLCALLPQAALTASAETYSGTCGAEGDGSNLTWSLDTTTGLLTISGSGEMAVYTYSNPAPWYDYRKAITAFSLPEGLTSIGNCAFYGCSALTSVTIPDSVTSIGNDAFSYCSALTSVTIPDSVTGIGNDAFSYCISLTSVTIPDSVTSIGWRAFKYCSALTSVTIPASVTGIDVSAFSYCSSLTSVTIPNSVTSIGNDAFYKCSALTSVTIPDSVTSIGLAAFDGTAYYNDSNNWDGQLLYIDSWLIAAKEEIESADIKQGTTGIAGGAFYGCSALTSVTIPDSVTSIGQQAFDYCIALTSVTIPDSVTSIDWYAFLDCSSLTSVTIPASVTRIGNYAFYRCDALTAINVAPGNLYYASINGVLFGKARTELIQYPAGKTESSYQIPTGVTSIGKYAFYHCRALTGVTIPDSVTSIGEMAFFNCSSLTGVTIPASVTSIGDEAFGYYYDNGYQKIEGFAIYGYPGTAAESYATENGFSFVPLEGFSDVALSDYFFSPVMWATTHVPPITAGVAPGYFGPNNPCTREQIVTFLWAVYGKPELNVTGRTFSDVPADAWYYKPVMWAVENKITSGLPDGSFGVGQPCTRAQAMTFLWASKGKPAPASMVSSFSDVSSSDWFCKAILWAAENGITKGVGNGLFGVNDTCTRAQIITFLYKAYN